MPLRLIYQGQTTIPVEIEGLTPDWAHDKTLTEIERFEIFHGNEKLQLAEFFRVSGDASDERIDLEGNLAGVHWIGAGMKSGMMHVHGDAGRHVGSEMSRGEIHVDGDAGDWVGGEMHGGLIHVRGRAGHLIGAAYRGSRRGMTGGTILIGGDVGNEVGHTMRRGTLVVGGGCGDFVGFNMIAGSIFIFGPCGIRPAAGMRRGTVGLFGPDPPAVLSTFRRGALCEPVYLRLIARNLASRGFSKAHKMAQAPCRMYHGDAVALGRGELLLSEVAGSS